MTAMRWNINYRQFVQNKHNKVLKDQPKILAPALRSIWNEFQNHIQMTGNLNVYYLVKDKLNFINNSNRSSLDFATYYLQHFWYKEHRHDNLSTKFFNSVWIWVLRPYI